MSGASETSGAIRRNLGFLALTLTAIVFLGCFSQATNADLNVIEEARVKFRHQYVIKPRNSIYIEARHLSDECPEQSSASELYKTLFLKEDGSKREDSVYTYLNFKDQSGSFCYQLVYDRSTSRIEISSQAYY